MILGVPRETASGERRVALAPETAAKLVKSGHQIRLEAGAGLRAGFKDEDYASKGVTVVKSRAEVFQADVICQVQTAAANDDAGDNDLKLLRPGQVVIGCAEPLSPQASMSALAERGVTLFALELIPRTTRAQAMDVLSSQANLAGYMSVVLAAHHLPKAFPMFMTAAGTVKPARVFIIGAGVAGLQAIATAKRLGGIISAFDVRAACREQVESLGARFVELPLPAKDAEDRGGYAKEQSADQMRRQQELMAKVVAESDIVITTAAIPGRKAPVLVSAEMVHAMRPGSVIVDLAAERGGNCELTKAGEVVDVSGVQVIGPRNLPSQIAHDASLMYGNNVANFLALLSNKDRSLKIDTNDDIIAATLVCRDGEIVNSRVREALDASSPTRKQTLVKEGSAA